MEAGSRVYTDEHGGYRGLPYATASVNHGAGEYVRGNVHTNSIESFWSTLKRCYVGTHHWWSHKHSVRYVDACAFRQNHDEDQHGRVSRLVEQGLTVKMPYKALVAARA